MVNTRSSREAGLTMLEVVIATVILTLIVGMASWLVWSASGHVTTTEVAVQLEMNARELLEMMTKEIHQSKMNRVEMLDTTQPIPCDGKSIDISMPTPGKGVAYTQWSPLDPTKNKFDSIRFRTPGLIMDLTAVDEKGLVNGKKPPHIMDNSTNANLNGKPRLSDPTKVYDNFDLKKFKDSQGDSTSSRWLYEVQYWWEIDNTGLTNEGDTGLGPNGYVPNLKDDDGDGVIDEGVVKKMETWYNSDLTVKQRTVSVVLRDVIDFKVWVPGIPSWVVPNPGQDPTKKSSYKYDPEANALTLGAEQNVVISITVSKADPRHPKLADKNIVRTYTTTVDLRN
jgi:hypothetical protein